MAMLHGLLHVVRLDNGVFQAQCRCGRVFASRPDYITPDIDERKDQAYAALTRHILEQPEWRLALRLDQPKET